MESVYFNYINYISIENSFMLAFSLFFFGLLGVVFSNLNLLFLLMSAEVMLLGPSLNFIFFSSYTFDPRGQIFAFFIIILAAAEAAIGLGLLVVKYRTSGSINFGLFNKLKY